MLGKQLSGALLRGPASLARQAQALGSLSTVVASGHGDALAGALAAGSSSSGSGRVFSSSSLPQHYPGRAMRGLYGGKRVQFGNKVSEDGGNKSRRSWKPNVVSKTLHSDLLEESFKLKVTTYVLRCIKKHGSLDNYLLHTPERKIASQLGSELRRKVQAAAAAAAGGATRTATTATTTTADAASASAGTQE